MKKRSIVVKSDKPGDAIKLFVAMVERLLQIKIMDIKMIDACVDNEYYKFIGKNKYVEYFKFTDSTGRARIASCSLEGSKFDVTIRLDGRLYHTMQSKAFTKNGAIHNLVKHTENVEAQNKKDFEDCKLVELTKAKVIVTGWIKKTAKIVPRYVSNFEESDLQSDHHTDWIGTWIPMEELNRA